MAEAIKAINPPLILNFPQEAVTFNLAVNPHICNKQNSFYQRTIRWLKEQSGCYRIPKGMSDFLKVAAKGLESLQYASPVGILVRWAKAFEGAANGLIYAHTVTQIDDAMEAVSNLTMESEESKKSGKSQRLENWMNPDKFAKNVKNIAEFSACLLVVMSNLGGFVFGKYIDAIVSIGDVADLWTESRELHLLKKVSTVAITEDQLDKANTEASSRGDAQWKEDLELIKFQFKGEDGGVSAGAVVPVIKAVKTSIQEAQTLQQIKIAKVVVCILSAVVAFVPGGAVAAFIPALFKGGMLAAVVTKVGAVAVILFPLTSSALAIWAQYYKDGMLFQLSKIGVLSSEKDGNSSAKSAQAASSGNLGEPSSASSSGASLAFSGSKPAASSASSGKAQL